MDKNAAVDHPIIDLLGQRWSPRAFAERPVDEDTLRTLFEAARWSPSSYNEQPWRFLVAPKSDSATYDRLLSCLVEFNQQWAKTAPVLMLTMASKLFAKNGKPNPHGWHDVGLAMMGLTMQAMSMELYVHQMAGFDPAKARQVFAIPDDFDPVAAVAIGYLGDPSVLPPPIRQQETAPRSRRPMDETVFTERFGHTAPFTP